VLVDRSEERLSRTQRAVAEEIAFSRSVPIVADVAEAGSTRRIFEQHRPSFVFHLAGYKHVPLSEANPVEAVRDNVLTSKVLADAAVAIGASSFVLASSDKAVHPSNVLGLTKALCEQMMVSYERRFEGRPRFVAVRLGNVLGSSGSVARVFSRQIAQGGPLTVTDAEMSRYLITIPEAVTILLEATTCAGPGGVFVAEMGEPVKIVDLARHLIGAASDNGTPPLEIEYIGAREGEKLHEELVASDERVTRTSHPRLLKVSRPKPDLLALQECLRELERLVSLGDGASVRRLLR
jgi:FlaA1/EpsC-like NDP-sugar epimerase